MARVERSDIGTITRTPYETPEGFLYVEGVATRCGVFEYMQADGSIVRELRDDADVMAPASLASLGRKPATLEHPEDNGERVLVTPDNWDRFAVGQVGEEIKGAGGFVSVTLTINRADALDAIRSGVEELSCGYVCDIDPTPGVHPIYGRYDQRQTGIEYNHLAVVPKGRAGETARLRLDAAAQVHNTPPQHKERAMKIKFNGEEFDVDQALAPVLKALRADAEMALPEPVAAMPDKIATMDEDMQSLLGKYDAMCAKMDAMSSQMGDLIKALSEMALSGEIAEPVLEAVDPAMRGDAMDMSEEGKKARQDARDAAALAAYKRHDGLMRVARALKVDAADTLPTSALERAVAMKYLGGELRTDATPTYLKAVCDIAVAQVETIATQSFGADITSQRAQPRHDAASAAAEAKANYDARLGKPTV